MNAIDLSHIYYGIFDGYPGVFVEDLTTSLGIECYTKKQNFSVAKLNASFDERISDLQKMVKTLLRCKPK